MRREGCPVWMQWREACWWGVFAVTLIAIWVASVLVERL